MGWTESSGQFALRTADVATPSSGRIGISAWIKRHASMASSDNQICTSDDTGGGGTRCWQFRVNNFKVELIIFIGGTPYTCTGATTVANDSAWHWVAGTFDGSTLKVFYDSTTADGTLSQSGSMNSGTNTLDVGNRLASSQFYGSIAEVGIHDEAYSSGDLTNLFTNKYAPKIVDVTNCQHYWSLLTTDTNNGLNDGIGSDNLSAVNGVTTSDHPSGIQYTAGGASAVPLLMQMYSGS